MKAEFVTSSFVWSHGKEPRGFGSWGFQRTNSRYSNADSDTQVVGEIKWFRGTYSEAKKQAVASGMTGLIVVLP